MTGEKPFTCPFCGNSTTLSDSFFVDDVYAMAFNAPRGHKSETKLKIEAITCPNPSCHELALKLSLLTRDPVYTNTAMGGKYLSGYDEEVLKTWELLPEAEIKTFPNYIPKAILGDYKEACLIRKLSPKASATLSRRCLQGIIRDFWGIVKGTLKDEIDDLEALIDKDLWDAIDAIRSVGNIGAHMEKDINVIVDVDPNEAKTLIELIEMLLEEWYIKRFDKQQKLAALKTLAAKKNGQKKARKTTK
jgi:hypothetical protein